MRPSPTSPPLDPDDPLLMAVADRMAEGVVIGGRDGRVRFINRAAEQLLGWDAGEPEARSLSSIPVDAETRARLEAPREAWTREATVLAGGAEIPVRLSAQPIVRGGRPAGTLVLLTDLSAVRAAIAERDRARHNDRAKTRSLHMVAHDLSGPLTVLNGYVSLVADGSLDIEELRPYIPVLATQLNHMQRLVQVLLDTARLEEGRIELRRQPLDLGAFVVDMVARMPPLESGHQILVTTSPVELPVLADATRLDSIMRNVISNALKYSAEGTTVTCTLRRDGDSAVAEVADEGAGIAAEDLDRLFTRFGRVGDVRRNPAGVGLGLFLSRELARLHGGDLSVSSELGAGSTFTLRLPLRKP